MAVVVATDADTDEDTVMIKSFATNFTCLAVLRAQWLDHVTYVAELR